MTMRAAVVAEALTWLGTPYHQHAWIKGKGGGVDCIYMGGRVYQACGLLGSVDPGTYAPDWHMHRSDERYVAGLQDAGFLRTNAPLPGDTMLIKYGRAMSHAGILVEPDLLIHAYMGRGVILTRFGEDPLLTRSGKPRESSFWTLKGMQ